MTGRALAARLARLRDTPRALVGRGSGSVLLQAYDGAPPCDASLSLARCLEELDPTLPLVWAGSADGWSASDWPAFEHVAFGSRAHRSVAAAARLVVTTHGYVLPVHRDATVVQLWHGIPVKRLAADSHGAAQAQARRVRRAARRWDVFPSPSPFYDETAAAAMGVRPSSVVRAPYTRYADLTRHRAARQAVRERLGVAPELRLVLVAPTYRAPHDGGGDRGSALADSLARALRGSARVAFRGHYMAREESPTGGVIEAGPRLVTDALELLCAADVLVTDYSSLLVDAAVAGVPTVVCAEDHEAYRRRPGLHVDLPELYGPAFTPDLRSCAEAVAGALEVGAAAARGQQRIAELTLGPGPWAHRADDLARHLLGRQRSGRLVTGSAPVRTGSGSPAPVPGSTWTRSTA